MDGSIAFSRNPYVSMFSLPQVCICRKFVSSSTSWAMIVNCEMEVLLTTFLRTHLTGMLVINMVHMASKHKWIHSRHSKSEVTKRKAFVYIFPFSQSLIWYSECDSKCLHAKCTREREKNESISLSRTFKCIIIVFRLNRVKSVQI